VRSFGAEVKNGTKSPETVARVTVLIADAQPPAREGIKRALDGGEFIVCAEAAQAEEAVELARALKPDVCLVSLELPGGGINAISHLSAVRPAARVVALAEAEDHESLLAAVQAGAVGYIVKDINPDSLADTLLGVAAGEAALSRKLVARVLTELRVRAHAPLWHALRDRGVMMTTREVQVLELLRQGLGTSEIAERLWIAPVTVRRHISLSLRRLGVSNRAEAVRLIERSDH
jgi:DNA-binding NarL/FixJ family response regulator